MAEEAASAGARKRRVDSGTTDGMRDESRGSRLWGTPAWRSKRERKTRRIVKRGLLVCSPLRFAAPLAASGDSRARARLACSFLAHRWRAPGGDAEHVRARDRPEPRRLRPTLRAPSAATGRRARGWDRRRCRRRNRRRDLPELTSPPARDHGRPAGRSRREAGPEGQDRREAARPPGAFSSGEDSARGGRCRPALARSSAQEATQPEGAGLDTVDASSTRASTRAGPISAAGSRPPRHDLARRHSPGNGNGHGTLVAGLAAGSAPNHAGADPTAGIVSLDVMDDQGMARTSDVIAAAQWILKNHRSYNIRVANFSLHSGPRPASAGIRSTRPSRSSGSRVSSSSLPPATRARAASPRRWPTRPRTTRS